MLKLKVYLSSHIFNVDSQLSAAIKHSVVENLNLRLQKVPVKLVKFLKFLNQISRS